MRLLRKNDASLAIALVTSSLVIFQRPLRLIIDAAREAETRYGIDLLPGLTVLVGALAFHQYKKWQQSKIAAATAATEIAKERQRSAELERLVAFGTALSHCSEPGGIRQAYWRFMPAFARDREVWMLNTTTEGWDSVVRDATSLTQRPVETLEGLAARTLQAPSQADARTDGVLVDEDVCFPMEVGDSALGVVGVRNGPLLLPAERRALGAAVGLLGSAIRNVQLLAQTRETSLRDQLTGCFNRAYAVETLGSELQRAKRSGRPLSVMMFDVDKFKRTNDDHGHLAGDAILAAVAAQCSSTLRASDIKCRWGGDEFLIILPDTPLSGAEHAGGSLTREIASVRVRVQEDVVSPTISLGVAVAGSGEEDPMALIGRADEALYKAKHTGRNRFVVAAPVRAVG